MAKQGITGDAAEQIIRSITSFALYGFPESHAASFALLVYASAYLKAHYPAAFSAAMLNNQPMGFYHPSTLVKDAQRHGVRFAPIDVQVSGWHCRVDPDGRVRLGLMYVNGLRKEAGEAIAGAGAAGAVQGPRPEIRGAASDMRCPKCGCDDPSMLETLHTHEGFCNVCSHLWTLPPIANLQSPPSQLQPPIARRFDSLDQLIRRCALRRDEVATLAQIGALNAFGFDRRTALWQVEQAVRTAGELFTDAGGDNSRFPAATFQPPTSTPQPPASSPLQPMTVPERLLADYAGTRLTIGPHPMSLRRPELALRGVLRASELPSGRHGRRVRVAGAVITRQRPGTAKGFVFLTLEDETGIANIIVRPDLFSEQKTTIVGEPYLLVEGTLQIQEGVTSVKAERLHSLGGRSPEIDSHDFR
jgi:error-prone DNA polymerase